MHAAAALTAVASILSAAAGAKVRSLGPGSTGPAPQHLRPSHALVLAFAEPTVIHDRALQITGFEVGWTVWQ